eukprot:6974907-Pyramimonas_sp.AAC.1
MHAKIVRAARVTKRYHVTLRLAIQGGLAAANYAHQLYGTFGTAMTTCRRRLGDAVGPRLRGRCLTTLLDLKAAERDPAR